MDEGYLTIQQAAARAKVSRQSVYGWIDGGELRAEKPRRKTYRPRDGLRIRTADLEAFLAKRK